MKQHLAKVRRRCANFCTIHIVHWRLRLAIFVQRLRKRIGALAVSLFSFVVGAAIIIVPQLRATVDSFEPLESVLSQLGATYGTILALVLTLSIIPIQRAAEVWSPSIVRLYRRDPVTYVTFVTLSICCAASFLLAVRGLFPVPVSVVVSLSLAVLGSSLDMLRWYHAHVCRLMDPVYAISLVLKETKQAIDRIQKQVAKISRMQHQLLDTEQQRKVSIESIESTIYPQMPGHPGAINQWINDLAEIGIKAVARGEKLLAKTAVFAIADLTNYYLSSRKFNLTLQPAPEAMFLAMTSDVNVVTNCAYEVLQEVSRVAVAQGDEATAIRVSEAYQVVAIHTASLDAPAFHGGTAPLTYGPIYYAFAGVKYAQSKGLDEIAFQSARILSKVAETAPKDTSLTDIHVPVIDGLAEIAMYFYGKRNYELAEEVNGHHFTILALLLQRQDSYFDDVLQHVLEKMEMLAPLAIANEALVGSLSTVYPLVKAYGLVSPHSLGYLFEQAAVTMPRLDAEREWINPYYYIIDFADKIAHHLRMMAEKYDFGESFLLWEIDKTIEHISKVLARIVDQPLRRDHGDETELVGKLPWMLSFYWVAFRGKKTVSRLRADQCCESLMSIGLRFLERGHHEVLPTCISNIRSIVESYCEIAQPAAPYTIGDLLAHLWGIRIVLVARHNDALIQEVDRALNTKPRGLSNEQWQDAQEAIQRRRQQLEERLEQSDDRPWRRDSGEALLRSLLQEALDKEG